MKTAFKTLAIIFGIIIIAFIAMAIYVNSNKKTLLVTITKELNKNLNGTLTIESMDPTLIRGFPGVSLTLNNVVMRDSLWTQHRHTLLQAKDFNVSVNALALVTGRVVIKKIEITGAKLYLYTDTNGYSNTSIFKKKKEKQESTSDNKESSTEIKRFILSNVNFVLDNRKGRKLFEFALQNLDGKIDYPDSGWNADISLKALAKSLAFNTTKGSFIQNQQLEGPFSVHYNNETELITIRPNTLKIGKDGVIIGGRFNIGKDPVEFSVNVIANDIMWRNAAAFLAPKIKARLDLFKFKSPINVKCDIIGDMGGRGDPFINVIAKIKNNELTTPGGMITNVNFIGEYTNNFVKGKGYNNTNSAVKLYHFSGAYEEMPFKIDTASINNFVKPIATGIFQSQFPIAKLNNVLGDDLLNFTRGTANVKLAYKADIINFKLTKPIVTGIVDIKNADVNYVPRKLKFTNTSISLNFTGPDLFIKNIRLQSGKSIVFMEGSIRNFLNLYYSDPEKILLNWQIRSPQLHLAEFMGFFASRTSVVRSKKRSANTNLSKDLNAVFEKSKVNMHLRVDRIYYNKFLATNAVADLLVSESGIKINNASVKHGGGSMKLTGNINQQGGRNRFAVNTALSNVSIKSFFYGFDNFGFKTFSSENLRGNLFSKINITGNILNNGKLSPNSLNGSVIFDLKKGALIDFAPIINVGKFAFPLRDLNNITFNNLNGKFDIKGQRITINPMLISSSVLNMNVAGVYSLNKGTNIALDVPLRNPKNDEAIKDAKEKRGRRMSGIVLHLLATDGEDGKIKFKLNRSRDK